MNNMVLKAFHIIIIIFLCILTCMCSVISHTSNNQHAIRNSLKTLVLRYNIPGVVLSYSFGNTKPKNVSVGYSNIENDQHMSVNTLFRSGSSAKSMTAAIILTLVEKRKLSLDENLSMIAKIYGGELSRYVKLYPDLSSMTLRQLLNHTSGVPQSINTKKYKTIFSEKPNKYWSTSELLNLAMQQKPYFKPGTKGYWSYTNTDYILLAVVIESVTKSSLEENYKKLWRKANLKNIFYVNHGEIPLIARAHFAMGYVPINDNSNGLAAFREQPIVKIPGAVSLKAYQLSWNTYNSNAPGAGGVLFNARTLVKWYQALFEDKIITPNLIKQMLNTVANGKFNEAGYGLGVTVHTLKKYGKVISHDGLTPGYSVNVFYFVKYHLTLAVMTNSTNPYVSTFDVHNGKIINGVVTNILPVILAQYKT